MAIPLSVTLTFLIRCSGLSCPRSNPVGLPFLSTMTNSRMSARAMSDRRAIISFAAMQSESKRASISSEISGFFRFSYPIDPAERLEYPARRAASDAFLHRKYSFTNDFCRFVNVAFDDLMGGGADLGLAFGFAENALFRSPCLRAFFGSRLNLTGLAFVARFAIYNPILTIAR
jgi:hypothetical protein